MTVLLAPSHEAVVCFWHHGGSIEALTAQTGTVEDVLMLSALLR